MKTVPEYFGSLVFDDRVMKANLSTSVYRSLKRTIDEGRSLDKQISSAKTRAGTPAAEQSAPTQER